MLLILTYQLRKGGPARGPAGWPSATPTLTEGHRCDIDGAVNERRARQAGHGGTGVHVGEVWGDTLSEVVQGHSI